MKKGNIVKEGKKKEKKNNRRKKKKTKYEEMKKWQCMQKTLKKKL